MDDMSVLILERTTASGTVIERLTCVPGAEGIVAHNRLRNEAGGAAGKPVWCWDVFPPKNVLAADFTGAIIVQPTWQATQAAIDAFKAAPTAQPEDVLTFAE